MLKSCMMVQNQVFEIYVKNYDFWQYFKTWTLALITSYAEFENWKKFELSCLHNYLNPNVQFLLPQIILQICVSE